MSSIRALKAHKDAALKVLERIDPNETLEQLASRVASAVVEAEDKPIWIVICDAGVGNKPWVYGPYGSAATARKAMESGMMLIGPRGSFVMAMSPVPRKNHTMRTDRIR